MELKYKFGITYFLNGLLWGLIFNISKMLDDITAAGPIFLNIVYITLGSAIIFYVLASLGYLNSWIATAANPELKFSPREKSYVFAMYLITKYFVLFWPALYISEIMIENKYPKIKAKGLLTELFGSWDVDFIAIKDANVEALKNVNVDLQWKIDELEKMKNVDYEFDDDEAEKIWVFGNKLTILALLMFVTSIIGILTSLALFSDGDNTRPTVLLFEFIFLIVISVVLFRPSDNFKKVATSEGRDMAELLVGLKEFKFAFSFSAIMIVVIGISNFILILNKI